MHCLIRFVALYTLSLLCWVFLVSWRVTWQITVLGLVWFTMTGQEVQQQCASSIRKMDQELFYLTHSKLHKCSLLKILQFAEYVCIISGISIIRKIL